MEMNQLGLLEELLLAQSSSTGGAYPWTATFHGGLMPQNSNTFDNLDLNSNSSFLGLISSTTESSITFPSFCEPPFFNHVQNLAADPEMGSTFMEEYVLPPFPIQEDFEGREEDVVQICPFVVNNDLGCKVEGEEQISESVVVGEGGEKFNTSKMMKVGAPPSKNLMAERRRRKRLNDRLSMLRSIVPKISKMDRTAIVGDTIDYMKELLDKIQKLREDKDIITGNNSSFDDSIMPVNHSLLRNNPKFEVERTKEDTRIELCCNAKPGMLLSTLGTLETLGLDVQQCVISCFNDFSLQASCSEVAEHRGIISPEDIKQALFRNAGYGGRCL